MSTRCKIDFVTTWKFKDENTGKEKTREDRRSVYRHSDGYPDGVIPDLKEFVAWNKGRNNDIEFMSANFLFWSKRKYEDQYLNSKWEKEHYRNGKKIKWNDKEVINDTSSILKVGFGVCDPNCWHGDLEFYYEVNVNGEEITIKGYSIGCDNNKVKNKKLVLTDKVKIEKDG
jgi:hypothetical protein